MTFCLARGFDFVLSLFVTTLTWGTYNPSHELCLTWKFKVCFDMLKSIRFGDLVRHFSSLRCLGVSSFFQHVDLNTTSSRDGFQVYFLTSGLCVYRWMQCNTICWELGFISGFFAFSWLIFSADGINKFGPTTNPKCK